MRFIVATYGTEGDARPFAALLHPGCETIFEAGEGCDAILVAGLAAFAGFSAAEYLGVKSIGSGMIPITPTAVFPSPFVPPKSLQFDTPEICWEFDADQEQARESRLRIMALAADNTYHVAGAHLDSPGVGRISRLENRYRFDPL
jgi:hypothetical protein